MPLALLFLYAVPAAIILVLGRGLLWLLSFFGIESWGLSFAFALALGVLVSPTMVAGDGVGLLPWILAPGDLSWGHLHVAGNVHGCVAGDGPAVSSVAG